MKYKVGDILEFNRIAEQKYTRWDGWFKWKKKVSYTLKRISQYHIQITVVGDGFYLIAGTRYCYGTKIINSYDLITDEWLEDPRIENFKVTSTAERIKKLKEDIETR